MDAGDFDETVLYRIVRRDAKGRRFGTPRNPNPTTIDEFNPRLVEIRAGDLAAAIVSRRHGIWQEVADKMMQFPDDELIRFRPDDPISASGSEQAMSLTGGHHRINEIIERVANGRLDAETIVRVLLHD
jgi:hypothetical protein